MGRLATLVLTLFALAAAPASAAASAADCLRYLDGVDLQTATIPDLQAAMAAGTFTSRDLVEAYEARIAAYDTAGVKLTSVRALNPAAEREAAALDAERASGRVRGPLHGVPVLLKDNVATADLPTTAGSIALEGARAKRDATIVQRLRNAGAIILGKANLSEFAGWVDLNAPPGWSSLGGQVLNAYDFAATPSGSSAGSGVAASMALAAATIGTETSGSILSPTDANGDVGVKTTLGLVSRAGILPLAPDFDVPGPIVRSVVDAAIVLDAIRGPDERDALTAGAPPDATPYAQGLNRAALRGRRFAYSQDAYDGLSAERQALFDRGIERLKALGAEVVAVQALSAQYAGISEIGAIPNEFKSSLNAFLAEEMPTAKVRTLSDVRAVAQAHPDTYKYGTNLLDASDATPGIAQTNEPSAAPIHAAAQADIDAALAEGDADAILAPGNAHANIGAAAGYPTAMVPLGYTGGGKRPMGLGFMGKAYSEPELLAFAYAFEQATKVRVAPTDVNPKLKPTACPAPPSPLAAAPSGAPATTAASAKPLPRLRVSVKRRGHVLLVRVRGVVGKRVRLTLQRGKKIAARRTAKARKGAATIRVRAKRRGVYRVTVLDPGPPPRTARARARST